LRTSNVTQPLTPVLRKLRARKDNPWKKQKLKCTKDDGRRNGVFK
jgi:hypothetical protein